jgi:threonine aldolase
MRQAMFEAEVGDDVFGEDPTVNRLEEKAAEISGKAAALFLPSGTMGNQTAIAVHTSPGQEVIAEDQSHIILYEFGMLGRFSGCISRTIPTADGRLTWPEIRKLLRGSSDHYRGTGLIALENSHNHAGGRVYSTESVSEICANARAANVPVHMDGARVFNAAVALGKSVREVVEPVDSVAFCLSKGLGAPVGTMLAGSRGFIAAARDVRKALGGGMRQAGVLAAAGLVALEESPAKIAASHAAAKFLAESLAAIDGIAINPSEVETNILFFDISGTGLDNDTFVGGLKSRGVLVLPNEPGRIRMVTHHDVDRPDCERALKAVQEVCSNN